MGIPPYEVKIYVASHVFIGKQTAILMAKQKTLK